MDGGPSRPKKSIKSSHNSDLFGDMEFHKPPRIPRIPRANPNSSWDPANLETLDSGSTNALMTRGQPESVAMEKYYNDDSGSYGSQPPSRNGHWNSSVYGNGNGYGSGSGYRARAVINGSRDTRSTNYDQNGSRIYRH
ncbi:hypothetical protein AOLI_G00130620 [Acnodon oligacanthus]